MSKVFISYSHKDEGWKDRVCTHLGVLAQEGKLELWDDRRIAGGDDWEPEIEKAIQSCDVALLLISADFLTSRFILGKEVPPLLQRRAQQGVRVIPVILRPCAWTQVSWLKGIQARPKDGKPLSSMTKAKAESALAALVEEVIRLVPPTPPKSDDSGPHYVPPDKIDLSKLPQTGRDFLGRETELRLLDDAWVDTGHTHVVTLVAPGGVGKTALVKRWLDGLKADNWRGARYVYGWSFYSQGTKEDRQASEDGFLNDALAWFSVKYDPAISAWDKGRLLAEAVRRERTLLVLDGVEPLQYPPGPMAGQLRAPGVQAMLRQFSSAGQSGLCVVTTRERITDLDAHERSADRPDGPVVRHDLGNLSDPDGARLLHRLGVRRAGAKTISQDDVELREASHEVQGHALALTLLGNYLTLTTADQVGDIRQRDQVRFAAADAQTFGGHAFKVMAAYERWFHGGKEDGQRCLAVLRLLGLFDRPADTGCLKALRQEPVIKGLNEPLISLSDKEWNITLHHLQECGLASVHNTSLDAHPLVREYFGQQLQKKTPETWRAAHRRLYEHLCVTTPDKPHPTLEDLQPLYQAVAHGCQAGLQQEAAEKVYSARIRQRNEDYASTKLGAFGAELGAVAYFFDEPWKRVSPALTEYYKAWMLALAAFDMRALGRLAEAVEPMRVTAAIMVKAENWKQAAINASTLSELELTLGEVAGAVGDADQSVTYADRSGDAFQRQTERVVLADALHHAGRREEADKRFLEAEQMQKNRQPDFPLLYSGAGARYCDLLLADAEQAAWWLVQKSGVRSQKSELVKACREVEKRAAQTLKWVTGNLGLLDEALDHLTLGRAALYEAILTNSEFSIPHSELNQAVDGLRRAASQDHIPRGLLTRAWLRFMEKDLVGSQADLDEALEIAERGPMRLYMADIHLYRARLFRDKAELAKASEMIRSLGYGRRNEELADAEATANDW